jgi:hypothetical protein
LAGYLCGEQITRLKLIPEGKAASGFNRNHSEFGLVRGEQVEAVAAQTTINEADRCNRSPLNLDGSRRVATLALSKFEAVIDERDAESPPPAARLAFEGLAESRDQAQGR